MRNSWDAQTERCFRRAKIVCAAFVLAGAGVIVRLGAADDATVALPPFIVEEMAKGPPWRYVADGGYEVLSRCDDRTTRRVFESHRQLHDMLAEILPPALQYKVRQPRQLILYDEELQPAASREVIARMLREDQSPPDIEMPGFGTRGARLAVPARRMSFLPNIRLWDRDAMSTFMIVRRNDADFDRLELTPDYVALLVKSRLPALPPWFVNGILALYAQTKFEHPQLAVRPMPWVSEELTTALKKDPKQAAVTLLPLEAFFTGRLPMADGAPTGTELVKLWQAQSDLFVRWGLDERDRSRRAAFFKFVERSAVDVPTEKLFQEYFGFGYEAAEIQLKAYLPVAVSRTMHFRPAELTKLPKLALRNATDSEIARMKGDMERLEVPYVKTISPELAPKYLEQARRTLHRAYDRDDRDPRLLAVLGLCEVDAGNDAGAREFLESAERLGSGAMRPRACYELARLRFAEAVAAPSASERRLSVSQAVAVLQPLFIARGEEPPLPEVYDLIAEVWAAGESKPTRRHLAVLDEGVRLFPRRTTLAMRAAEVNLRYGFREEASALLEIAKRTAVDDGMRTRIAALEAELANTEAVRENNSRP